MGGTCSCGTPLTYLSHLRGVGCAPCRKLVWPDEVEAKLQNASSLIPCPCGCRLFTQAPGVQRCGCCGTEQASAHWDGLYGVCDGCAWCQSLGEAEDGECHHGECYEPIKAARERTAKVIARPPP